MQFLLNYLNLPIAYEQSVAESPISEQELDIATFCLFLAAHATE